MEILKEMEQFQPNQNNNNNNSNNNNGNSKLMSSPSTSSSSSGAGQQGGGNYTNGGGNYSMQQQAHRNMNNSGGGGGHGGLKSDEMGNIPYWSIAQSSAAAAAHNMHASSMHQHQPHQQIQPLTFEIDTAAESSRGFVRSDSILTNDDYVSFDVPAISSKYGPISRMPMNSKYDFHPHHQHNPHHPHNIHNFDHNDPMGGGGGVSGGGNGSPFNPFWLFNSSSNQQPTSKYCDDDYVGKIKSPDPFTMHHHHQKKMSSVAASVTNNNINTSNNNNSNSNNKLQNEVYLLEQKLHELKTHHSQIGVGGGASQNNMKIGTISTAMGRNSGMDCSDVNNLDNVKELKVRSTIFYLQSIS